MIKNKIRLLIDAGHGGKDTGAIGKISQEKEINLIYALELYFALKDDFEVYLTRDKDIFVKLRDRVELAKELDVDGFISIHCNASPSKKPNDTQIYYYNEAKDKPLADMVFEFVRDVDNKESKWSGVRFGNYFVLRELNNMRMPAILIELGFITNEQDELLLNDVSYQSKMCSAIAEGIKSFYLS